MKNTCAAVLIPCLISMVFVLWTALEKLVWDYGAYYPAWQAEVRYVDDMKYVTTDSMRQICGMPLTKPELRQKTDGLFLRCGTPVLEGVYLLKRYAP